MANGVSEGSRSYHGVRHHPSNPLLADETLHRTCFWGGDTFAPKVKVKSPTGEEVSIQSFLQTTFLNMWEMVIKAVGDLEGVLGFEVSDLV